MMKPEKILYETEIKATGGREGRAESPDGQFSVALTIPKGLGGPGGEGTNPEQLFAAGYAACFLSAFKLVSRQMKVTLPEETTIVAKVGIGPVAAGYGLAVELTANVPGFDRSQVQGLLEAAHERCPYSNATRGNIEVKLTAS